ncbi:MAG: cytidine deaminase [Dethiosulfovibrio peptidovorans]|nr:MAG: cytidine deaminase [Dethiosulfovibrio peptidovorans]
MIGSLDLERERLLASASDAASRAWCPYSRFPVGAALLIEDGQIVQGCNVESASYGLTCCAERAAVFCAVAQGYRKGDFAALAIYTPGNQAVSPCGACRQVLLEFLGPDAPVWAGCDGSNRLYWTIGDLLPDGFCL